jgi:hypothetical protein
MGGDQVIVAPGIHDRLGRVPWAESCRSLRRMGELSGIFGEAWRLYARGWPAPVGLALALSLAAAAMAVAAAQVSDTAAGAVAAVAGLAGFLLVQAGLAGGLAAGPADGSRQPLRIGWRRAGTALAVAVAVAVVVSAGLVLLVLPGLLILGRWAFAVPVVVLEDASPRVALGRSVALAEGHSSNVFAMVMVSLILAVAGSPLATLIFLWMAAGPRVVAASVLEAAVLMPYLATTWTLAYLRLRAAPGST